MNPQSRICNARICNVWHVGIVCMQSNSVQQPVMQVASGCILRVCWVPASQDRTYPVPLWTCSLCLVQLLLGLDFRILT